MFNYCTLNKFALFSLIFLFNHLQNSTAQSIGMEVGDSIPKLKIQNAVGNKFKGKSILNFSKNLLIIDFWSTGCGSCVEGLPRLHALQRKFEGVLTILPVTSENARNVRTFWKNNHYTKDLEINSVVEDTIFASLFKHLYIPHEVWIYKGKIVGITDLEYVDAFNINMILSGTSVNWPVKNDFYKANLNKNIFYHDYENSTSGLSPVYYTGISWYQEKVNPPIWFTGGSGIKRDTLNHTIRAFFYNQPILTSYLVNWSRILNIKSLIKPSITLQSNQIIWDVVDKTKYAFIPKPGQYSAQWLIKNAICYETIIPDRGQNDRDIYKQINTDLDHFFGLTVRWVRRKEQVLVIRQNSDKLNVRVNIPNNGKDKITLYEVSQQMNNVETNPYVFIDENIATSEVYMNMASWNNIVDIRNKLKLYGFTLEEEQRDVDKLLFKEGKEF